MFDGFVEHEFRFSRFATPPFSSIWGAEVEISRRKFFRHWLTRATVERGSGYSSQSNSSKGTGDESAWRAVANQTWKRLSITCRVESRRTRIYATATQNRTFDVTLTLYQPF
jgi:hypothetical protein